MEASSSDYGLLTMMVCAMYNALNPVVEFNIMEILILA
jgi:hypothetical protein